MKITLANPRGFCAGVEMAIEALQIVVDSFPPPVYVYHEIVHNQRVVTQFESQGVRFVSTVEEVPRGSVLVFSAHGISPAIRAAATNRQLHCIDATCPLVAKVHAETRRFAAEGYHVLLIGHAGHDEVVGTLGEAPAQTQLIESVADVEQLQFPQESKLAYLTQTTLGVDETAKVVARLRARFPKIEGPPSDDICYATQNRQQAVRALAADVDLVCVVGSQNSSNSQRLCDVVREHDVPAYLVDDATQLDPAWFHEDAHVGITAGASAPETAVQSVLQWLQARYQTETVERGEAEPARVFPLPASVQALTTRS